MDETARRATAVTAVVGTAILVVAAVIAIFSHNPDWNHGGNPADPEHPNASINAAFDPKYTMLLYMDMEDSYAATQDAFRVRAIRLQFPANGFGNPSNNTWQNNQRIIAHWINFLNAGGVPTPAPQQMYVKQGLTDFNFNQPHHVAIYIQNQEVDFNHVYPVWFSDILIDPGPNGKPQKADKNWSFFAAKVETPRDINNSPAITGNYSKHLIYMKNFYRARGWLGNYTNIGERQRYSLNINVLAKLTDTAGGNADTSGKPSANILPITIDPDTGNMGGGDPT